MTEKITNYEKAPNRINVLRFMLKNEFQDITSESENGYKYDFYKKGKLLVINPKNNNRVLSKDFCFFIDFDPQSEEIKTISEKLNISPIDYIKILKKDGVSEGWLKGKNNVYKTNIDGLKIYSNNVLEEVHTLCPPDNDQSQESQP